jgi:hypothetical protein
MIRLSRKHRKHTTRGLLAVVAGLWLLASAAPCVMAQPMAYPQDTAGNHCPNETPHALVAADNCDALAALNCRLPDPNPPSATLDLPAPAPMLLQTLPAAPAVFHTNRPPSFARAAVDPPTLTLNRKQSRLLI